MQEKWIEKIYAGFLGMDAGMRLGAPVENPYWTYERLREYYGDMRGYLREYKHYAADDDVNGPVIFLRALTDFGEDFTAEQAGETWLNYTRCGHGMFWWGGEDLSTEHRAYMNLKRGVKAPESGSMKLNGPVAAEQIGGQIFVDTWGLIYAGNPVKAAEQAVKAASVSHDGEGLHGAAFMAAAIAAAFTCTTVDEVIDTALTVIPADCGYRRVVDGVRSFHRAHPEDFRACRDYIDTEWGEHKYPGYCHIIPNAGVCILALLYGEHDLGRTIEVSCMCGFDTDCNASNVGTITGVLGGLERFPTRYRTPINDCSVLSSVSGYLNMVDHAAYARELAVLAYRLAGEEPPAWLVLPRPGDLRMDFELPGSTHGLELTDRASHWIRPVEGEAHTGSRCLEMMIDGKLPVPVDLYFKASFTREDFNDERYEPVFSPRVYPGQTVSCFMKSWQEAPAAITVTPFVSTADGQRIDLDPVVLPEREWHEVVFTVPDLSGDQAHDIGWKIEIAPVTPPWTLGRVFIDDITVTGPMDYTIDTGIQKKEFGEITPFSRNELRPRLEDGALVLETDCGGQTFTGNYYARNGFIEADATPLEGDSCLLLLRAQGTRRFYALGLQGENRAVIARFDSGAWTTLASAGFPWKQNTPVRLRAEAEEKTLRLLIDGTPVLETQDSRFAYGMTGICHTGKAASRWRNFHIKGQC